MQRKEEGEANKKDQVPARRVDGIYLSKKKETNIFVPKAAAVMAWLFFLFCF